MSSRAIGCASFVAILVSIPLGLVGAFLLLVSDSSTGGGPTGGLSAFAAFAGIAILVVALVVLVIGAIAFIRSADD